MFFFCACGSLTVAAFSTTQRLIMKTLTPVENVETNVLPVFLDWEYLERTHTFTGRTWKNFLKNIPGFKPRTFFLPAASHYCKYVRPNVSCQIVLIFVFVAI